MIKTTDKIILGILVVMLIGMSGVLITALNSNEPSQQKRNSQQLEDFPQRTTQIINALPEAEIEDEEDKKEDIPITGSALEKASAVALEYIGEGRVTDTEIGDEEGYYEIEITLDNGREVDVHLDEDFKVLGREIEDEEDED